MDVFDAIIELVLREPRFLAEPFTREILEVNTDADLEPTSSVLETMVQACMLRGYWVNQERKYYLNGTFQTFVYHCWLEKVRG